MTQTAIVAVAVAVGSALATFIAGYAVVREQLRSLREDVASVKKRLRRAERYLDRDTGAKAALAQVRRQDSDVVALQAWEDSDRHDS